MTPEAKCPACDTPLSDGALYCASCGLEVTLYQAPDAERIRATDVVPRVRAEVRETLRDATLGEYEILHELGRGGMATVYLAHDISLDRRVAIKVIAPHLFEGEGMAERFKLEARTAAQLSHPHIIPIYSVRETASTIFFVMKHVEGRGLEEIIAKRAPLPVPMVKEVLSKVSEALGYAHKRNVVHRDVKPANILIDETGMPVVTDFGIAKVAESTGLTMTGATMGTPSYMSPEQCEAGKVSGASDQYSLGVVAYQMLSGQLPFEATNPFAVMYKHCHEPPPPIEEVRPDLPREIVQTVNRMLAKNPDDRWPSMDAVVRSLNSGDTDPQMGTVRSELIALAQGSDPDLPVGEATPVARPEARPDPDASTPAAVTGPGAVPASPTPQRRRRSNAGVAVAGVAVAVAGILAATRPWGSSSSAAPPPGTAERNEAAALGDDGAGERAGATAGAAGSTPTPGGEASGGADSPSAPGGADAGASDLASEAVAGGVGAVPPPDQPGRSVVATVRIDGVRSAMEVGEELQASAVALDRGGTTMASPGAAWSAADASVLRISSSGLVTAVGPGRTIVSARIAGVEGQRSVDVVAASVGSVTMSPSRLQLTAGEEVDAGVDVRDARGGALSDRVVAWTSADPSVARVTPEGRIVAASAGTTTVTAEVGGVRGTVEVSVAAAAVSTRAAVEELVDAYARALESGDIDAVRAAYPGITAGQARDLDNALAVMEELRVDLSVQSLDEQGDQATAVVAGTYSYVNASNGRREQPAVSFIATFERAATGAWRLLQTR